MIERWRVMHGDCIAVMPRLGTVDAIVTDPPYGVGLTNNDVDGHRSQWGKIQGDESQRIGEAALADARCLGAKTIVSFASPWKPWSGRWRNLVVWDKGGAVGGGGDVTTCLKRSWELIQVWNVHPFRGRRAQSVWYYPMLPTDTSEHIAAKPVELMRRILTTFTDPDDLILDPFCGSGTTGVACVLEGRRFLGIEIDAGYCAIAERRIADTAAQGNLFGVG